MNIRDGIFTLQDCNGKQLGMAFLVTPKVLATCYHVIEKHVESYDPFHLVNVGDPKRIIYATLDKEHSKQVLDIAYLRTENELTEFLVLPLTDFNDLQGKPIKSAGIQGSALIIAEGHIVDLGNLEGQDVWEFEAGDVDQGFSGAPIWVSDAQDIGPVAGMITAIYTGGMNRSSNLNFAILSATLLRYHPDVYSFQKLYAPKGISAKWLGRYNTGDIKDKDIFFNREAETTQLLNWIFYEQCKVVVLLGVGGIGKTSCINDFLDKHGWRFSWIFGRAQTSVTLSKDYLRECIKFLSSNEIANLNDHEWDKNKEILIELLQKKQCLMIIDGFERVLEYGKKTADSQVELKKYLDLFLTIVGRRHQSCLVITSRTMIDVLNQFAGNTSPVRKMEIKGLDLENSSKIFLEKNVILEQSEVENLVTRFSGHPNALVLITTALETNKKALIEILRMTKLNQILNWHYSRMTKLQKMLVVWLAIENNSVSSKELQQDLLGKFTLTEIEDALANLKKRMIIREKNSVYSLENIFMEYAIQLLIDHAVKEIKAQKIDWLDHFALIKASSIETVRLSQRRLIMDMVCAKLKHGLGHNILEVIKENLRRVKAETSLQDRYAPANLLHILLALDYRLNGWDFSGLTFREAYLADARLNNVNFENSTFSNCTFADTFGWVISVVFDPQGKYFAAGDYSGKIMVWDVQDFHRQQSRWTRVNHDHQWVQAVEFSPDSRYLASTGEDGSLCIWVATTGELVCKQAFKADKLNALAYSPDGKWLALGGSCGKIFLINTISISTGKIKVEKTFDQHTSSVTGLVFHPHDCNILISSGNDNKIILWNIENGDAFIISQDYHREGASAVAFHPGGHLLASSDYDGNIAIWNMQQLTEPVKVIKKTGPDNPTGHRAMIYALQFDPTGEVLASCSLDHNIHIWDTASWECKKILQGHTAGIISIAFNPKQPNFLASGGDDFSIRFWDIQNNQILSKKKGTKSGVSYISLSPDEKQFAVASPDGVIGIWNSEQLVCEWYSDFHREYVFQVNFHPRKNILVSSSNAFALWNNQTGELLSSQPHEKGTFYDAAVFSSDGEILITADEHGIIDLWNLENNGHHPPLTYHKSSIYSAIFIPGTNLLATVSDDTFLYVYDIQKENGFVFKKSGDFHLCLASDPIGSQLASAGYSGDIHIWNTKTWKRSLLIKKAHTISIQSMAYTRDGNWLVSGGGDNLIKIWDAKSGALQFELEGHDDWVECVAVDSRNRLYSGSDDGTLRIWDLNTQQLLKKITPDRYYERMNMLNVKGLNKAQLLTLAELGAIIDKN